MDHNMRSQTAEEKAVFTTAVLEALGAFEPPKKLTTTLQVRVTEDTANRLDALVHQAELGGVSVTRSDLVRAAVSALVAGTDQAEAALARIA
jgi:hypothetical protein